MSDVAPSRTLEPTPFSRPTANSDGALDDPPPDPLILFTVLYGTYPCNFTEFLKDPQGYLQSKGWQGPRGDGDITQDWAGIKDRSAVRSIPLGSQS